ncbi:MAG: DNA polymerase III subunit gamma/tau [Elusimicrobia bacterium]|nr:DNA polymerase III subunit gamma/tau [Elusimicrobiota bacterium]
MKNPAPHLGLARKYRPQSFDEVIGQEAVTVTLKNAVAAASPAHAYLFFGPRGIGKTTTARILAKALNCEKGPTPEPCGKCGPCVEIAQSSDLDVLELDAATHTQVEKIREMIIETVQLAPARDRHKVFIIDEVHMLSASSFNALLKTLEEPPAHVVFVLATTEPAKIPPTIISRCQRFRFRPLSVEALRDRLADIAKREKIKAEPAALDMLARAASGSLRDAVCLFDQAQAFGLASVSAAQVTDLLGTLPEDALQSLAGAILARDGGALGQGLERVLAEGFDPSQVVRDLRERLQAAYLFRLGVRADMDEAWKKLAAPHGPQTFSFLVGRLNRILEQLRSEDSPRLAVEQGLYAALEPAFDLAQWTERLEALEKRLGQGGGYSAPAAAPAASARPAARPVAAAAVAAAAAPHPNPGEMLPQGGRENDEGGVWGAVLAQLREEKPGLASYLESARLVPGSSGPWKLAFARSFELEQAKRNQGLIEAKLSTAAGQTVRLSMEIEVQKAPAVDEDAPAEDESSAAGPAPEQDPAVRKVLEVFPGKVRPLKKKP